jgi:hypothetical protein
MSMEITQLGNNAHQPAYIVAASTTTATTTTAAINDGNETPTLCDIKILCTQRKKVCNFKHRWRSTALKSEIRKA